VARVAGSRVPDLEMLAKTSDRLLRSGEDHRSSAIFQPRPAGILKEQSINTNGPRVTMRRIQKQENG
jgi:hypothetical protein